MIDTYYKIKEKLGLRKYSDKRIKKYELLYPERTIEELLREKDEKTIKNVAMVLAAVCAIIFLLILVSAFDKEDVSKIERNPYGGGTQEVSLSALVDGEECSIDVNIGSAKLSDDEIEEKFAKTKEEMLEKLKADNSDFEHIKGSVDLDTSHEDEDVSVYWQCDDYDLIDYKGDVQYDEDFVDGSKTYVRLILTIGDEKKTYEQELILYKVSEDDMSARELLESEIEKADKEQESEEVVNLPNTVGDKAVIYLSDSDSSSIIVIVVLGIIAAGAVVYKSKKDEDDEVEKRNTELEVAYPELVSKLGIYIGAGLSVRAAIEKIVNEYKNSRSEGGKRNVLYEELALFIRNIESGKTEEESFRIFGDRVPSTTYLRLVSVLESNRKNGRAGLESFLFTEAKEAGTLRLEIAKRQGEKISSKLLLPMIMLFAIVLVVLIIPAFMGW